MWRYIPTRVDSSDCNQCTANGWLHPQSTSEAPKHWQLTPVANLTSDNSQWAQRLAWWSKQLCVIACSDFFPDMSSCRLIQTCADNVMICVKPENCNLRVNICWIDFQNSIYSVKRDNTWTFSSPTSNTHDYRMVGVQGTAGESMEMWVNNSVTSLNNSS